MAAQPMSGNSIFGGRSATDVLQIYCSSQHCFKGEEIRRVKERREEEAFVGAHDPCRWWGAGSLVVFHWEREQLLPSQIG